MINPGDGVRQELNRGKTSKDADLNEASCSVIPVRHQSFSGPATQIKIAADGKWEQALIGAPSVFVVSQDLDSLVQGRTEIACEAFFGEAFFGVRRRGTPDEIELFVRTFVAIAASAASGDEVFTRVKQQLNVPVGERFGFAEIGAVDAWKSVGPFHLDDPTQELIGIESLMQRLKSSSVGQETQHAKAIEFAFDNGDETTHWIALPISRENTIEPDMLKSALGSYTPKGPGKKMHENSL